MPRQARIDIPGCLYHVIGRGIERRDIFLQEYDYNDFHSRLAEGLEETGNKCLAWCFMPNHFHLLILRGERPLSELMRKVMTGYALGFNKRSGRSGHLFQNRYKALICDQEEYLLELTAYIHLNPMRAGLVRTINDLEKYKWCGYGVLTGTREVDFLERDYVLAYFGKNEKHSIKRYRDFLLDRIGRHKKGQYSGGGLKRSIIESAAASSTCGEAEFELSDERILGRGRFVEAILEKTEGMPAGKISRERILKEVENKTGIRAAEILSRIRSRKVVRARALYCHLMKEKNKAGGKQLMEELELTCGAVSILASKGRRIAEEVEK